MGRSALAGLELLTGAGGVPRGAPEDDTQAAGPVDMEPEQARTARAEQGSGQQLQEGEG